MTSTKDVIDHHLKAFGERDLQGVLSDYAPPAVLFTPQGKLQGPDAIRPLFQAMIAESSKPGAAFKMRQHFAGGKETFGMPRAGYKPYAGAHPLSYDLETGKFEGFGRRLLRPAPETMDCVERSGLSSHHKVLRQAHGLLHAKFRRQL